MSHRLKNLKKKDDYVTLFIENRLKKLKQNFPVEIKITKNLHKNEDLELSKTRSYCKNILIPLSNKDAYLIQVEHFIGIELFATILYKL